MTKQANKTKTVVVPSTPIPGTSFGDRVAEKAGDAVEGATKFAAEIHGAFTNAAEVYRVRKQCSQLSRRERTRRELEARAAAAGITLQYS